MGAASVTGVGPGEANKPTAKDLATLNNGPVIYLTGYVAGTEGVTSPPSEGGTIVFPKPLPGPSSDFVVILTTINGGSAYIASLLDNDDDEFYGFTFISENECDAMYMVVSVGIRPSI